MEVQNDEISLKELIDKAKEWWHYLLSQWKIIVLAGIIGACLGLAYSFIKKPIYTATLSFALEDENTLVVESDERILGDIYISVDKAKSQSKEYRHSLIRELSFLSVHGLLHLLGYDHIEKEDEKIMFEKQELILDGKQR